MELETVEVGTVGSVAPHIAGAGTAHVAVVIGAELAGEPAPLKADAEDDEDLLAPVVTGPKERKGRVEAFHDRVAADRAEAILGQDYATITANMASAPKKVAEKAYNALCFIAGRTQLSNFTKVTMDALLASTSLTVTQIAGVLREQGMYSEKTARSQAQQQMMLLPLLHLAVRSGNTLTVHEGPMLEQFQAAVYVKPERAPSKKKAAPKATDEDVLAEADKLAEPESSVAEEAAEPEVEHVAEPSAILDPPTDEDVLASAAAEIAAAAGPSPSSKKKTAKEPKASKPAKSKKK